MLFYVQIIQTKLSIYITLNNNRCADTPVINVLNLIYYMVGRRKMNFTDIKSFHFISD